MTIVTLTRNSCCHHARVWNKQNTIRPMLPNHMSGRWRCYKKRRQKPELTQTIDWVNSHDESS